MTPALKKQAQIIAPEAYPQMMSRKDAARAAQTLRSTQATAKPRVVKNWTVGSKPCWQDDVGPP